jgi:hypothetical protein
MKYENGIITLDINDLKRLPVRIRGGMLSTFVNQGELSAIDRDNLILNIGLVSKRIGDFRFFNGKGKIPITYNAPCDRCHTTRRKMITPTEYRLVFYPKDPVGAAEHICIKCITKEEVSNLPPGFQRQYYKIAGDYGISDLPADVVQNIEKYLLECRAQRLTKIPIIDIGLIAKMDTKSCGWGSVKRVCNDLGWFRFTKKGTHAAVKQHRKVIAAYADHLAIEDELEMAPESSTNQS